MVCKPVPSFRSATPKAVVEPSGLWRRGSVQFTCCWGIGSVLTSGSSFSAMRLLCGIVGWLEGRQKEGQVWWEQERCLAEREQFFSWRFKLWHKTCAWTWFWRKTFCYVSYSVIFVGWHSIPVEILLEEQGGVLIDLFRHLSLVRNRRDAKTVKLNELLEWSSGH